MKPAAVFWYQVYAVVMTLLYVAVALFGLYLHTLDVTQLDMTAEEQQQVAIYAWVCPIVGIPLALVFAASLFLPRAMWSWIIQLILICLGLTSCCFWPICIPLLIFYIKADTRAWFGLTA